MYSNVVKMSRKHSVFTTFIRVVYYYDNKVLPFGVHLRSMAAQRKLYFVQIWHKNVSALKVTRATIYVHITRSYVFRE